MGYLRFFLSVMIMAGHLGPPLILRWWPAMAVIVFYALSGYLGTLVFIESYGQNSKRFLLSRLLRLYPTYLVVFGLTVALLLFVEPQYLPVVQFPTSLQNAAAQLLMIVRYPAESRVVPTAWMLKWIFLGYILVALGCSKNIKVTWAWAAISLLYTVWLALGRSQDVFYGSFPLASLALSIGGLAYWSGFTIPKDRQFQAMLGAISYPVFLIHLTVGAALNMPRSWPLFFAALGPTLAISWLLVVAVERPVERHRKQLRQIHGH